MNKLKNVIRNCEHATFLIEKQLTEGITFKQRLYLQIHLLFCSICRRFNKQSKIINIMVKRLFNNTMRSDAILDADFKNDLQKQIDEKAEKNN